MDKNDIRELSPGDSIIGFAGLADERMVAHVGEIKSGDNGKLRRVIKVRYGNTVLQGLIVEGDSEQRSPKGLCWCRRDFPSPQR